MKSLLDSAQKAVGSQAQWTGIRWLSETTTLRQFRDGKPQTNRSDHSQGVMVEVLAEGMFAYASTPQATPAGVAQAAKQALAQAQRAARFKVFDFNARMRPASRGRYQSPVRTPFGSVEVAAVCDHLKQACETLKRSPKIIKTEAAVRLVETQIKMYSSAGAELEQEFSLISTDYNATAQDAAVIQTRTDNGMLARSYQSGLEMLFDPGTQERLQRIAEQALELVAAPECPTQTTSLVLMPDQMMLQIHESIGHPLEIDRILGDERNYAGWSFVKPEDFGKLIYGSPLMNVTFDPTLAHEFASYAFDDAGEPAKRTLLIEKGILKRGLGGLESQARSNLEGVANFRSASWNRAPIDRMANLNLEAGDASFDDIITSVEDGVLMESNRSWSIDDFRNKFQFGCEYGRRIRQGKLAEVVRNPNYRGVTNPFWRSLKRVGNEATRQAYGTPYCGKGEPNQIIRVGHASPVCLFKNIEVFGGAS
ncbi:MAG: TldD/PmbA family protein [Bacteriovoracia bacterium]